MTEFTLPALGDKGTEADVVKWLVAEGTRVDEGQPILEVAYEKVNVEIPAPASGTLTNLRVQEGEVVNVGQTLATID